MLAWVWSSIHDNTAAAAAAAAAAVMARGPPRLPTIFCEEGISWCSPASVQPSRPHPNKHLPLATHQPAPSRPLLRLVQPSELTAGKGSKPTVVAGAISNRAREGGCPNITGAYGPAQSASGVQRGSGICTGAVCSKEGPIMVCLTSQTTRPLCPTGIDPEAVCNAIVAVCSRGSTLACLTPPHQPPPSLPCRHRPRGSVQRHHGGLPRTAVPGGAFGGGGARGRAGG